MTIDLGVDHTLLEFGCENILNFFLVYSNRIYLPSEVSVSKYEELFGESNFIDLLRRFYTHILVNCVIDH